MNAYEKKRKAAMIAVAYYIEQEKASAAAANELNRPGKWVQTGKEIAMNNRFVIQRRGRLLRSA